MDKEDILPAPRAMINLETWLPSNYEVNGRGWNVKDIGALGTGGRYVDLELIKILISI